MKGINLPASVMGIAFVAVLLAWCWGPVEPVAPPDDGRAVLLAESLATALEKSKEANRKLRDSVATLPDSVVVRWAVKRIMVRDTAWRMWSPDSIPADTSELVQAREVIKKCETDLSAAGVVIDSTNGELVQCRFDAQTCADDLAKRPTSCRGWSAFGYGTAFGLALGAAGCAAGR